VPLITCAEAGNTSFPVSNGAIKHADIAHKKIRFDFELHPFRMVLELPRCCCDATHFPVLRSCSSAKAGTLARLYCHKCTPSRRDNFYMVVWSSVNSLFVSRNIVFCLFARYVGGLPWEDYSPEQIRAFLDDWQ
jgi:hypothetical protein